MMILYRAGAAKDHAAAARSLPGLVHRAHRLASGDGFIAICEIQPADLPLCNGHVPAICHAAIPVQEGIAQPGSGAGFNVMVHLAWDASSRALDSLWPEVVQALSMLETPRITGAYRLAGQQEAIIFAEVATSEDLNQLAAIRLFHGVAMDSITTLGAPFHTSVLRSASGSASVVAEGETPASSQRLPVM